MTLPVEHVQGGEQGGGAVALVVVGHRARPPGLHRQRAGCGPGPGSGSSRPCRARSPSPAGSGRGPTTSTSFSSKRGSLESLNVSTRCGFRPRADQIRCTVAGLTPALGHRPAAPVRLARRLLVQRHVHDLRDLLVGDRRLASPARAHPPRTPSALLGEPLAPRPHRRRRHPNVLAAILVFATPSRPSKAPARAEPHDAAPYAKRTASGAPPAAHR